MKHRKAHGATAPLAAFAALPLLLSWPPLRHLVESRMLEHMLLEFPALFAAGWALHRLLADRAALRPMLRATTVLDWRGWTGATLLTIVPALWMLPTMLDMALLSPAVAGFKYAGWWVTGYMLAGSWSRLDGALRLYVLGNFAWMSGTVGMLYLDASQRLCVSYLESDQRAAGMGLILVGCAAGIGALRLSGAAPLRPSGTFASAHGDRQALDKLNQEAAPGDA